MGQVSLVIIGVTILVVLVALLVRPVRERAKREVVGICGFALDQTVRKQTNKQKALALLGEKGSAGNEEIREVLGVSRQSVARYMTELERAGRVEQMGEIGRGVVYRLK